MKSQPYVPYLVLGVAAVALWFAWHSAHRPAGPSSEQPAVATASPSLASTATTPAPAQPPVDPGIAGSPVAPSPGGAAAATAGLARGQAASASEPHPGPNGIGSPLTQAAQIDAGRVRHMISDYHTLMNENPVGTNAEIMKQLMGANARQATLGPPEGMSLDAQGELLDPWGTPYFFHQLSRDRMEVRSAGPDKVMWTADDIIAR